MQYSIFFLDGTTHFKNWSVSNISIYCLRNFWSFGDNLVLILDRDDNIVSIMSVGFVSTVSVMEMLNFSN